jgi:ribosome biogenesis GTPase
MLNNNIESYGFDRFFAGQIAELEGEPELVPARVVAEERGNYRLAGCRSVTGKLRGKLFHTLAPVERPVVGDWVAVRESGDVAVIHHVFTRKSLLSRRAAGSEAAEQPIAANVDTFFIVTAADRDFNVRRIERYLAAVWSSGAGPVIVVNKIDLGSSVESLADELGLVSVGVPLVFTSAVTGAGLDELREHVEPGRTFGLIGSSGVGKSSLVNALDAGSAQVPQDVRPDGKGRHTTTRRELIALPGGALLIDTPGMREFGMLEDDGGVEATFADIAELAADCRFRDCRHEGEPGCAVAAAVEAGDLDGARLESYHKLQLEIAAVERKKDPRHAGRPKRRWKEISKVIRKMKD